MFISSNQYKNSVSDFDLQKCKSKFRFKNLFISFLSLCLMPIYFIFINWKYCTETTNNLIINQNHAILRCKQNSSFLCCTFQIPFQLTINHAFRIAIFVRTTIISKSFVFGYCLFFSFILFFFFPTNDKGRRKQKIKFSTLSVHIVSIVQSINNLAVRSRLKIKLMTSSIYALNWVFAIIYTRDLGLVWHCSRVRGLFN